MNYSMKILKGILIYIHMHVNKGGMVWWPAGKRVPHEIVRVVAGACGARAEGELWLSMISLVHYLATLHHQIIEKDLIWYVGPNQRWLMIPLRQPHPHRPVSHLFPSPYLEAISRFPLLTKKYIYIYIDNLGVKTDICVELLFQHICISSFIIFYELRFDSV